MKKPQIYKTPDGWRCFTLSDIIRITGQGRTASDAYMDWHTHWVAFGRPEL